MMMGWGVVGMRMRWGWATTNDCDRVGAAGRKAAESNPEGGVKSTRLCYRFALVDQNPACVLDSAPVCYVWLKHGQMER